MMANHYFREINPFWALVKPLTVEQAAALMAGEEPNAVVFSDNQAIYFHDPESGVTESNGIVRVNTAYKALTRAIWNCELDAEFFHDSRPFTEADFQALIAQVESGYSKPNPDFLAGDDERHENGAFIKLNPNWSKTTVKFDDISVWLRNRGIKDGFFFPQKAAPIAYLDPNHPRYSGRLAAAIRAWEAMEDQNLMSGKSPKAAMADWLHENNKEFGLVYNGVVSNEAIERVSYVANWQTEGGSPKTPSEKPTTL